MRGIFHWLAAGLWCASAVQMASYVWECFSRTGGWGSFPGVDGNSATSPDNSLQGGSPDLPQAAAEGIVNVGPNTITDTLGKVPVVGGVFNGFANLARGVSDTVIRAIFP